MTTIHPRLTVTLDGETAALPDAVVARLQVLTDRTNATQKTTLTALDWIALNLKELAVSDQLTAAVEQLRHQHEKDANDALTAAINTARGELIASLADAAIAGSGPE